AVATVLITQMEPAIIVFSGVAGGLDPDLEIGDMVIAERLVQHDAGIREPGGIAVYQAGHLPFLNPVQRLGFETDGALLDAARERHRRKCSPSSWSRSRRTGRAWCGTCSRSCRESARAAIRPSLGSDGGRPRAAARYDAAHAQGQRAGLPRGGEQADVRRGGR